MSAMWRLVWPAVAFVVTVVAALALRALLARALRRRTRAQDGLAAFLRAVRLPSFLWTAVLALYVAIEASELPPRLTAGLETVFQAALILSVTFTAASLVATLVGHASERRALGLQVTGLAQTVARVTIYIVGALVLLSVLGIHVTPILTALGVGGLAVALALQDSLSNLFAGLHLLADPAPFTRFIPGFGESSLDFTLICQVASFVDQYLVQHELRKRILRRLRAEGIEIPYPVRTVELRDERPDV